MNKDEALGLVRHLIALGQTREQALDNSAVPPEFKDSIKSDLEREDNIVLEPARFIYANTTNEDWLQQQDRSKWYYWPTLRIYLLSRLSAPAVQSIDDTTDRILGRFAPPTASGFDARGLVLGYVQSGKTTNFTATIAKAADCGYRLIIVLSGIDNGLRRQTQIRLEKELIGSLGNSPDSVPLPPIGRQWHEFTTRDLDGDFRPGTVNPAALQGDEPVIMIVKKNSPVLKRLLVWLDGAPEDAKKAIPTLVIDDEADLASIDTRGTYLIEGEQPPEDYDDPSVINGLIRELLNQFQKKVYVAYTATPFANIFIPHDTFNPEKRNDLYPKDFIVDLPKPDGYFGAEELFGIVDPVSEERSEGLDIIREVTDNDLLELEGGRVPHCLENSILGFVLSCAAMAQRGRGNEPATMLIHVSHLTGVQADMKGLVEQKFSEFKDNWRYQRALGIRKRLSDLWNSEFRSITKALHPELDVAFDAIEPNIGPSFEAIQIRTVNSATGEVLDYEREPELKAIAIGGNKFSRGLTLEGLMTSFFIRPSPYYDTLMQMGRWFGFRRGYEDLTRIWTTAELAERFTALAFVEHSLRDDIRMYESMSITPYQVGMRIWQHPTMQVTSQLKRRYANPTTISQSYSGQLAQTFKFPLDNLGIFSSQEDDNRSTLLHFLSELGTPTEWDEKGPIWRSTPERTVLAFLGKFRQGDWPDRSGCSLPLICSYIEHQFAVNELTRWTVAIRGRSRESKDNELGEAEWRITGGRILQISRTRLKSDALSLGVITSPGDETVGFNEEELQKVEEIKKNSPGIADNVVSRKVRPPQEGLILIYPISKKSRPINGESKNRQPLFENPSDPNARDLIALAVSFPVSQQPQPVQAYLEGTVGWRPVA